MFRLITLGFELSRANDFFLLEAGTDYLLKGISLLTEEKYKFDGFTNS